MNGVGLDTITKQWRGFCAAADDVAAAVAVATLTHSLASTIYSDEGEGNEHG